MIQNLTIIGGGLIGSSLARAAREKKLAAHLTLCDANAETRAAIEKLALADGVTADPAAAVSAADLVVLSVPVGQMGRLAAAIGPALKPGAIVTDVGSVKAAVVDAVLPYLPSNVHFVPGHPIAGTEKSGPAAGFAALFEGRFAILTPLPHANADAISIIETLWQGCGMKVVRMTAAHHDHVLAITSHLPHLIAYTIVGTAADLGEDLKAEVIRYSAGGFRDFTRIAGSDPTMWRDVFLHNRPAVLDVLQRFTEDLTALQRAIRKGEGEVLFERFTRTRAIRQGIIDAHQHVPEDQKTMTKKFDE